MSERSKRSRLRRLLTGAIALLTALCILLGGYMAVVWGNLPVVTDLRNIWIQTAMTTFTHQWLATSIFPDWLINDVMDQLAESLPDAGDENATTEVQTPAPTTTPVHDILGQEKLVEGEEDEHGNKVLANNIDEGVVMLELKGKCRHMNYTGRLVLIDDPSRVFVGTTDKRDKHGQFIVDLCKDHHAIAGINASGFLDPGGHGTGGVVSGLCYSEGESWGKYNEYPSITITKQNQLVVGFLSPQQWEEYEVRDGIQFNPAVIVNGQILVDDSFSLQPRTLIAQRADGVMMMMVVDGRGKGGSWGITYLAAAKILLEYGAVNAAACDGGSSSVLCYDGKLINKTSSPLSDTGRYLPNAFLVRSKKYSAGTN